MELSRLDAVTGHLEAVLKETSGSIALNQVHPLRPLLLPQRCGGAMPSKTNKPRPAPRVRGRRRSPWAPDSGGGSPDCSLACRLRLPSLNHNQQADSWVRSPAARLVRRGVKRRMAAAAKKVGAHWLRGAIAQPRPRGSTPLPSGAVWCWPQTSCCCVGRKRASRRA